MDKSQTAKDLDYSRDDFQAGHAAFTRDDVADIAPWWTAIQALAWVVTRIPSFVHFLGKLEAVDTQNYRPQFVHRMAASLVAASDEGQEFLREASGLVSSPDAGVLAYAGRALLVQIQAKQIVPTARESGVGRRLKPHAFAGIGQDKTGEDWLIIRPKPIFASVEVIAVFPMPGLARSVVAQAQATAGGESECRDWLAREFKNDPAKLRSKADFRADALVVFPQRLTKRGFDFRVWPMLAKAHGRDKAGRKS